ncbi:MAG: hypothetical protein AB1625_10440 [Acidobacteriota bacterium]
MALEQEIVDRAKALFTARRRERRQALAWSRAALMNKAEAHGMGHGSVVVQGILRLCSDELRVLANLAWQDVHRAYELLAQPSEQPSAGDLEAVVHLFVEDEYKTLEEFYGSSLQGQPGSLPGLRPELDAALASVDAEIALFAGWRKRAGANSGGLARSTTYNFYSPIGLVVTGEHAQVAVQHIAEHRAAILGALDQVRELVSQSTEGQTSQIIEVVSELADEVNKEQPNPIKVSGALAGVASSIQTLASLQPAYEILKSAASLIGIQLP